ncbi:MAG: TonB-dependent receptor [Pseudomonadota bacterium]
MKIRKFGLVLGLSLVAAPLVAQDRMMEEIVVTAQKREQTLQEVPVAVSVVTSETLDQAQINDILDLQSVVPSLRVTQLQTSGNTNFIIRGFGNGANNAGIEPSVGVFVDGVYRSRSAAALTDLPNLERIEVLRGPQSTLFGKNASAGVINIVTAPVDPAGMSGLSGSAAITGGNFNQVIVKGDVAGALSETIGFGLSGYSNTRDGYFTNLTSGSELNERNRWGVRGELFFAPVDDLTVRFIADLDQIDEQCCGVANLVNGPTGAAVLAVGGNLIGADAFARQQFLDFDPVNDITNSGFSLQADYALTDNISLTSITGLRDLDRFENADVDFTSAALVSRNTSQTDIRTFTQEFRLAGQAGAINWLGGLFYFDEEVSQVTQLDYGTVFRAYGDLLASGGVTATETALGLPAGTFFAAGQGVLESAGQDDTTYSLFAQADWDIGDRTVLTLGVNYTNVEKNARVAQVNTDSFSQLDLVQVGFGAAFGAIAGLPPTPANIAANPAAAGQATAISTIPCSATNPPPACNQLLGLAPLQFLPPYQAFPNAVESGISDEDSTTWTVRIAYDATDYINVYASAGTGFKATSWNLSRDSRPFAADLAAIRAAGFAVTNITSGTRFAGPEESTVYELGLKGNWGRNSVNLAIFSQEIDGFQSNVFTGAAFTLANAGKQSSNGIEVEANWAVTNDFDLTVAGTFLDPKYDSFPNSALGDLSGQTPAGIHEASVSIAGTYYYQLGNGFGFIRADYLYEDEVQVVDNVPASVAARKVGMLNASVSYTFSGRYEVMLWGRNLTNDDFLLSAFPSVAQAGSISGYPNQPRTYGVTLRTRFN